MSLYKLLKTKRAIFCRSLNLLLTFISFSLRMWREYLKDCLWTGSTVNLCNSRFLPYFVLYTTKTRKLDIRF